MSIKGVISDIDGCLWDLEAEFVSFYNLPLERSDKWEFYEQWGIQRNVFLGMLDVLERARASSPSFIKYVMPLGDEDDCQFADLTTLNVPALICSSRSDSWDANRASVKLGKMFFGCDDPHMALGHDIDKVAKAEEWVWEMGFDKSEVVVIEDAPRWIEAYRAAGFTVRVVEHKYNAHLVEVGV